MIECNANRFEDSAPGPSEGFADWVGGLPVESEAEWPVNEDMYQDPDLEADPSVDYFGLWSER